MIVAIVVVTVFGFLCIHVRSILPKAFPREILVSTRVLPDGLGVWRGRGTPNLPKSASWSVRHVCQKKQFGTEHAHCHIDL